MLFPVKIICAVLLLSKAANAARNYYGAHLGALSQLEHGVSGDVYAVDSRTLFLKNFRYDGEGPAAWFYVGNSKKPSSQGATRLRDERGSTAVLRRYRGEDITLSLPEGKTLRDIKWFYVWCDEYSVNFGDVPIPKNFDFPRPFKLAPLKGVHGVSSDNIVVVDAQTILIPNFSYDGEAPDAKFWVGRGENPTPNGVRIPDENGRIAPLRRYERKTIVLTLPGDLTIFDIGHFGVWCEAFTVDFGHVKIASNINVPPSLKMLGVSPQSKLNCEVLYDDLAFEVRWAVAGESIVIQLVAKLDDGEYMSFGLSPDRSKTFMVGADVAVAWIDKNTGKGYAEDYFLDAKSQCSGNRGSCPDTRLGDKTNSIRVLNAATVNGYSIVTYQRPLKATDEFDLPIIVNSSQAIAWAIGPLNQRLEVSFHSLYSRSTKLIQFGREPQWNCPLSENDMKMMEPEYNEEIYESSPQPIQHTQSSIGHTSHQNNYAEYESERRGSQSVQSLPARVPLVQRKKHWEIPPIQCHEPDDGVFYAQMGPTGGKQGYPAITGHVGWGISWYINGLLIPEINVVRGKTYTFVVEGGNDPDIPAKYHPFYISDDSVGGYEYKSDEEKANVHIFAGVKRNRYGNLIPTGIGRLCNWTPADGPPADDYSSFGAYQRSLTLKCEEGSPGIITWRPDHDTPDTVYYHCFTHRYLGWKINVLDSCEQGAGQASNIEEIYANPDQPDPLQPAQSIRHETKVKANDLFLLQNERKIDNGIHSNLNTNNLENRNDKTSYEFTKMIANGILAAEALEDSLKNRTKAHGDAKPLIKPNGDPVITSAVEPLPIFLTPPKNVIDRPFRFDNRSPILRERNNTITYILPNRNKNHNTHNAQLLPPLPPSRKVIHERQKVTKISMPPLRRDYNANSKPIPQFPLQNKPWSLQKHLLRGPAPALMSNNNNKKFSGPIKITKKDFHISSAKNIGFQPNSVVVESGFTPISERQRARERERERESENSDADYETIHSSQYDTDDYPEQKQRRSDTGNTEQSDRSALLIKTFEPMFIPSPLDSTSVSGLKSSNKRLTGEIQNIKIENDEDKMIMAAGERHAYYLPPDNTNKKNGDKSTKLYPAGSVVTFDGRAVVDKSLVESEPAFSTPKRSENIMSDKSSTEQLLNLPQFGPFRGEIPPLSPEQMKPNAAQQERSI